MNNILCGARLVLYALVAVSAYISVHEGGHALAAISTGRTVADVRILSLTPNVSLRGSSTPAEDAFAAAAGSGLVVVVWFVYTALRRSRRVTFVSEAMAFFAGIELLAWLVSAATHSIAPPDNDVTKFIAFSGVTPALLTALIAVLAGLFVAVYCQSPAVQLGQMMLRRAHAVICCCVRQWSVPRPNTRSTA